MDRSWRVCETQISTIVTNSKYGLGHKDKHLNTSITSNIHKKYENSGNHCLKVINKGKGFRKKVKLQGQGQKCFHHKKQACEISKL